MSDRPLLSDDEREILCELAGHDRWAHNNGRSGWARPMDVGGRDASHHSATLAKLTRRGLVERKRRAGYIRPSYLYRIAPAGHAAGHAAIKS